MDDFGNELEWFYWGDVCANGAVFDEFGVFPLWYYW